MIITGPEEMTFMKEIKIKIASPIHYLLLAFLIKHYLAFILGHRNTVYRSLMIKIDTKYLIPVFTISLVKFSFSIKSSTEKYKLKLIVKKIRDTVRHSFNRKN